MVMPQLSSSWKELEAGRANLLHQRRVIIHQLSICKFFFNIISKTGCLCCCDIFFGVFHFDKSSLLTSACIVQRQGFSSLFSLFYCCTNNSRWQVKFFLVCIACSQEVRCQLNEISQDFHNWIIVPEWNSAPV